MSSPSLSVLRGTWSMIRFRPVYLLVNLLLGVAFLSTQVVPGWLQKLFFDDLIGVREITANLWLIPGLILLVEVARSVVETAEEWGGSQVRHSGYALLRKNIVQNVLSKPGAEPLPVPPGDAVSRLDNDAGDFADFPTWLPEIVGHALFAFLALLILYRISPLITAVALLPLVGVFFLTRFAWQRFLHYYRESSQTSSQVTAYLGEIFNAVQAIKVADATAGTMGYFGRLNEIRRRANVRFSVFYALFQAANDNLGDIAVAVMVLLAGRAMSAGTFTIGDFVLFSAYLLFLARFPATIGSYLSEIAQQRVVLDRMQELQPHAPPESLVAHGPLYEHTPPPLPVLPTLRPEERLRHLRVRGLTYRYGDSGGVEDVDLDLPAGSFTVITGRVGAGKTTLLRVLLGLLPREAGEIDGNGQRVDDPATFFVPPRAAYTPQVPRLFSDSLRDNILLGLSENEVDLRGAVEAAVLAPDVARLEAGLDTLVGPRGVRLSGGQVQRAAAARMLVRRPELLVFDDLSSALDVETERQLWQHLLPAGNSARQVTCLVVSHRPAVLQQADQIIVLRAGRVVAQGTFDELQRQIPELARPAKTNGH